MCLAGGQGSILTGLVHFADSLFQVFTNYARKVFDSLPQSSALLPSSQKKLKRFLAGGQGIEPRLKASKASVLPLDDPPIVALYHLLLSEQFKHCELKRKHWNRRVADALSGGEKSEKSFVRNRLPCGVLRKCHEFFGVMFFF